jgi:hypothetical protein
MTVRAEDTRHIVQFVVVVELMSELHTVNRIMLVLTKVGYIIG